MSEALERDFFTSPGEHYAMDCWCGHTKGAHRFDPQRDYRELLCDDCPPPAPSTSETTKADQ